MPIRRTIDHESRVVITQCVGVLTDHDIQIDQRTFWSQDWIAGYGEVFDMAAADVSQVGKNRSRYAAVVAADETTSKIPVALVYANETQRALAERYIKGRRDLSSDATCAMFDNPDEALVWLREQI